MSASALPPIYADTPLQIVPYSIVASFPANTFLENIAVAPGGTLFVTSHEAGHIVRIAPGRDPSPLASTDGKVTGITVAPDGELILTGWDSAGTSVILGVSPEGRVTTLATLGEAQFLNGITPLTADTYLTADSYRGCIWQFHRPSQTVSIWLEHPLLARSDPANPLPAANGIKRFGKMLYVSNTEQMKLLKIPLESGQPGELTGFVEPTNIDDFAFDRAGNLYGATHIYNSVLKITPTGETTVIASAEQGVIGSTAVAFGRGADDQDSLYVVTNGGMFLPPPGGVVPANVVRLQVGQSGYALNQD